LIPVKVATYTTIGAILPVYVMDEILKITLSPFVIALSFSLIASLLISVVFLPLLVKQSKRDAADALTEKDNRFTHFILWLGKKKKTSLLIIALLLGIPGIPFYYFPFPNQIPELEWYNNVFNTDTFKDKIKPAINYTFGGAPYVYINDLKDKFSWGAFRTLGDEEEKRLRLFIRGPSGMRLEDMNAIMGDFEQAVQPFIKVVDHTYVSVFAGGASMEIFFDDDHYYDGTPEKIKDKLAEKTVNFGGLDLFISGVGDNIFIRGAGRGGFASGEGALRYKLTGPSYNGLKEFAQQIEKFLEENRRVKNIEINASGAFRGGSQDQMELTYHTRMEPYEYEWIGNNMQNLLSRDETEFSVPGVLGEERIYIKSESQTLATVDDFNSLVFENDSLIPISLETLGDLKEEEIQSDITREDQLYVRLVSFEYRAAKKQIDRFKVNFEQWLSLNKPEDIRAKEDLNENTFAFEEGMDTWVVILITLLIVFAIVAMYFESYKYAAAIFLIVPFSLVGIIYFFFAMDEAIDSDAVFGLMFVAGIVINNAAFVIYEILRKRREGVEMNEALESTVIDRFRPVMLTTITTIIGILPLFLPQILAQVLDDYTIAYLSYYLPESISDFMFKNTNTDPMWYAMSLSIISGTTASFFFSLWVPVVVFYRRSKKRLIGTAAALIKTDS
ncbi:MAG: efflux RND transporter permease subunit, partial [Calditrichaeota bacterium]|nr:efflux RND transporter permease subunit [Calditrichota bacterium]